MADGLAIRRPTCVLLLSIALGAWLINASALASDTARAPQPTLPPAATIEALDHIRPGQSPLLREGSRLMHVRGEFAKAEESGRWEFVISRDDQRQPGYRLRVLPNRYLSEIEQVLVSSEEDSRLIFELSGRVTLYHSRNALLITSPPRVVSDRGAASDEPAAEAPPALEGTDEAEGEPRPRNAQALMEQMQQETGDLPRAVPGGGGAAEGSEAVEHRDQLLAEGTTILSRRGRFSRDAGGAWMFIFDADASGLADPPMTLLPCLLLERIEAFARQADPGAPVLLSGHVYEYEGRNYLLPTQFQRSRERTRLTP